MTGEVNTVISPLKKDKDLSTAIILLVDLILTGMHRLRAMKYSNPSPF